MLARACYKQSRFENVRSRVYSSDKYPNSIPLEEYHDWNNWGRNYGGFDNAKLLVSIVHLMESCVYKSNLAERGCEVYRRASLRGDCQQNFEIDQSMNRFLPSIDRNSLKSTPRSTLTSKSANCLEPVFIRSATPRPRRHS